QPFTSRVAGIEVVPEFDVVFVFFPAEKHFLAANDRGKVDQSAFDVLDENLAAFKFGQQFPRLGHRSDPAVDDWPSGIVALLEHRADTLFVLVQLLPQLGEAFEPLTHPRQQRARFFSRIVFAKLIFHSSGSITGSDRVQVFSAPLRYSQATTISASLPGLCPA